MGRKIEGAFAMTEESRGKDRSLVQTDIQQRSDGKLQNHVVWEVGEWRIKHMCPY
jgi:hypothetical protein